MSFDVVFLANFIFCGLELRSNISLSRGYLYRIVDIQVRPNSCDYLTKFQFLCVAPLSSCLCFPGAESRASNVPENFPVAFLLLEKTQLTTEPGCLSTFSWQEDRSGFFD